MVAFLHNQEAEELVLRGNFMGKLGLLVVAIGAGLLFFGYSQKADHSISLAIPSGYAAPIPIPKDSWKEKLARVEAVSETEPESVLELEMASSPVPAVKPATPARIKPGKQKHFSRRHARRQSKRVAKKASRKRPSLARR